MSGISEILNTYMENAEWIVSHYEELMAKYNEQWVSVHNGKVLDSDSQRTELWSRLKEAYPEHLDEIAIEYVTDKPMEMIL